MKDLCTDAARIPLAIGGSPTRVADYLTLTKPRLNFLVLLTTAAGYFLGARGSLDLWAMASAVVGTALVAGGAAALNQCMSATQTR